MGSLTQLGSGREVLLEDEHVVGRGVTCALKLSERYVSAQHAVIRWNGSEWELRDLGSLNGTFLKGDRLATGRGYPLPPNSIVAFGSREQEWTLTDDTPPSVMVVAVENGTVIRPDGDLIAIPSANDPRATVYRNADGEWLLEQALEASGPLSNRQTFDVGGVPYRFCCPRSVCKTSFAERSDVDVRELRLSFSVSRDEEHVHLAASARGQKHDLGSRSHNYLLLTLARRRLADEGDGVAEGSSGWTYQEDLLQGLRTDGPQLNLEVYRIRRAFVGLGVTDAVGIIERRPRTRQLRIGTRHLSIETL